MTKEALDKDAMARRRESWRQANASVRMEGGTVDEETLAMQERHISGDITKDQYRTWVRESIQSK